MLVQNDKMLNSLESLSILPLPGKHLVFPEIRNLLANITETERLFNVVADFTPELIDSILSLVVQADKVHYFHM